MHLAGADVRVYCTEAGWEPRLCQLHALHAACSKQANLLAESMSLPDVCQGMQESAASAQFLALPDPLG